MSEPTLISLFGEIRGLHDKLDRLTSVLYQGRAKYSLDEAATRLKVNRRTVERRIKDGLLHASREGGRTFLTESSIRDFEDHCRRSN